jgi:hypothetical protein
VTTDLGKLIKETANSLGNPTPSELVNKLVKEQGLKFKDASKAVYVAWKKGEIELSELNPPSNLLSFAFNLESFVVLDVNHVSCVYDAGSFLCELFCAPLREICFGWAVCFVPTWSDAYYGALSEGWENLTGWREASFVYWVKPRRSSPYRASA